MTGGGSSELRALVEQVRVLDARVTACEKDLIRLARKCSELALDAELPGAEARADAQAMGLVGGTMGKVVVEAARRTGGASGVKARKKAR